MALQGLLRVGLGFWHLQRLRKSCVPVDIAALDPVLQKTLAEFDSPRPVRLCVSDQLRVPTAIGFTKPLVVIPSWTMQELSAAELNTILLHELAHLRRRDDWTNLVQKILGALLFFHPAVWWIEKKLALEREMACDDMVLARPPVRGPTRSAWCRWRRKVFCGAGLPWRRRRLTGCGTYAAGNPDTGRQPLPGHASVEPGTRRW